MEILTSKILMYKEILTSKQNEYLNVRSEPENPLNKYAVCVRKSADIVGHMKKGDTGRFSKTISFFLRSHSAAKCIANVTGKKCNPGDLKGLIVARSLEVTEELCLYLKKQLDSMKSL